MRPSRLYLRIALHGLMVLLLAAVSGGFVFHHGLIEPRFSRPERPLRVATDVARRLSERPPAADLAPEVRDLGSQYDVALTVYGDEGALLGTRGRPLPPLSTAEQAALPSEATVLRGRSIVAARAGPRRYVLVSILPLRVPSLGRTIAVLAALGFAIGLGSLPLARAIARPIEHLSSIARRLGEGDLTVRSGIRRGDEIGTLARSFDEMAGRLQRLVQGQRELLVSVSHELRTPLARLRVTLGLAAEAEGAKARGYLDAAAADIDELTRLVEDTLAASRLDADPGSVHRERLDAREVVEAAGARFRRAHPARTLTIETGEGLPTITADASLLARVLDNLLDNARKYSDDDVVLAASSDEAGLRIEVRDRGIGIEETDLARLFTPFFRTDRSRSRDTGGVGLGLALAQRIVHAHGGAIEVRSGAGQGTTVLVRLPAEGRAGVS